MRRLISITGLISLLAGMLSCTDGGQDNLIPDQARTEVTFTYTLTRGAGDPAPQVLVFREQNGDYFYSQTISGGWEVTGVPDTCTRSVQLPLGDYKFLFAAGYGNHTKLSPQAPTSGTGFDAVSFQNLTDRGYILPADELYMQYPLAEADRVYSITGPASVSCTMRRVVSRLVLHLKRGYKSGETFVPQPYPDPASDNVALHLKSIDLILAGIAQGVSLAGSQGEGSVAASLDVTGSVPDADGFITLPGPFFIPRTGLPLEKIDFSFLLHPGSALENPTQEVDLSAYSLRPDQKMEITLWFDSFDLPVAIEAEIDTSFFAQGGDEGMWN